MSAPARLLLAAIAAYVILGLVYATWDTIDVQLNAKNPDALPPPWSSPMAFLAWFVLPAATWPWDLVGVRGFPELLVVCVYLATVGLFYLAASRRSAPRRLSG